VEPATEIRSRLEELTAHRRTPLIVALDGRSGAGKSTLAASVVDGVALAGSPPGRMSVIDGDDFYAGGSGAFWDRMSAAEKVAHVIDWRRQHEVLGRLREGRAATWHPFDWEAFDGRRSDTALRCPPSAVVLLEGAYSARPELADVLDLTILLDTPEPVRRERLIAREGEAYRDEWTARWHEAEELFFGSIRPPSSFDLVVGREG
jgi:uridine kinase